MMRVDASNFRKAVFGNQGSPNRSNICRYSLLLPPHQIHFLLFAPNLYAKERLKLRNCSCDQRVAGITETDLASPPEQ